MATLLMVFFSAAPVYLAAQTPVDVGPAPQPADVPAAWTGVEAKGWTVLVTTPVAVTVDVQSAQVSAPPVGATTFLVVLADQSSQAVVVVVFLGSQSAHVPLVVFGSQLPFLVVVVLAGHSSQMALPVPVMVLVGCEPWLVVTGLVVAVPGPA